MNQESYQKLIKKILITLGVLGVFAVGIFVGKISDAKHEIIQPETLGISSTKDFAQFWNVWKLLNEKFPFKEKIPTDTERIYGAISGMVGSFKDPYTSFFPPRQAKMFLEDVEGEFGGIGAEVGMRDGLITIITPMKNSPAEKAGLQSGDIVVKINGTTTENMLVDEAVSIIRGPVDSKVVLTIGRPETGSVFDVEITRGLINIPVIETKKEGDVFIINFYTFSAQSANLFRDALQEFKNSGSNKLIIDLRNNPGGYLNASIDIASYFLPQGKIILREDQGSGKPELVYRSIGSDIVLPKGFQLILLVNEGSASASEILAGAISEHKAGKVVGVKTFGKGSVQELVPLSDGSSVKITVAQWLTPNGVSISEKGITPDYIVSEKSSEKNLDPILKKALSLFK